MLSKKSKNDLSFFVKIILPLCVVIGIGLNFWIGYKIDTQLFSIRMDFKDLKRNYVSWMRIMNRNLTGGNDELLLHIQEVLNILKENE